MMLSNVDIKEVIDKGWLRIDPFSEKLLRPVGIRLHLGPNLLKPIPGVVVDVRTGKLPQYQEITMTDDKPYVLQPQEFLLGHTYERVTIGNNLGFFIEGRSTLARLGLTIVKTAMLVNPGHRDRAITLEIANHGPNPILLYPKMKISKAAIFLLKTPTSIPYDDAGKYKGRSIVGRPVLHDEFMSEE